MTHIEGEKHPHPDTIKRAKEVLLRERKARRADARNDAEGRKLTEAEKLAVEYGFDTFLQLPFTEQVSRFIEICADSAALRKDRGDDEPRCYDNAPHWNSNWDNLAKKIQDKKYAIEREERERPYWKMQAERRERQRELRDNGEPYDRDLLYGNLSPKIDLWS